MTSLAEERHPTLDRGHLRLVTFNLQVGIQTSAYHHYLTRSWQHLLPHPRRQRRLDMIAEVLSHFDMVGLQEVDGGSFRSNQVNQLEYLAMQGGFPHHYQQLNRNLGRLAQHSKACSPGWHPAASRSTACREPCPAGAPSMRASARAPRPCTCSSPTWRWASAPRTCSSTTSAS